MVPRYEESAAGTHRGGLFIEDDFLATRRAVWKSILVNVVTEKNHGGTVRRQLAPGMHAAKDHRVGSSCVANEDHASKHRWIGRDVGVTVELKMSAGRNRD